MNMPDLSYPWTKANLLGQRRYSIIPILSGTVPQWENGRKKTWKSCLILQNRLYKKDGRYGKAMSRVYKEQNCATSIRKFNSYAGG